MIAVGEPVRVKDAWPERHGPVHVRTPHYLRGRRGTVVRYLGDFPNPEDLAFRRPAPLLPLYQVAFDSASVWDGIRAGTTNTLLADTLLVEIYGSWLEQPA